MGTTLNFIYTLYVVCVCILSLLNYYTEEINLTITPILETKTLSC